MHTPRHRHHAGGWRRFAHPRGGFGRFAHDHDHGHDHRRGHGRAARVFDQGDLRWVILRLLADQPSHGYELIKTIEARLGGAYSPSPGIVYPTLTLLEEMGLIAPGEAEGGRRSFVITEAGREALSASQAQVASIFERMDAHARRSSAQSAAPVVRAMENLRTALRLRLGGEAGEPALAGRIAEILDEAALRIERS